MNISQRAGIAGIAVILVLLGGAVLRSHSNGDLETSVPAATSTPEQTDAEAPEPSSALVRSTQESVALKSTAEIQGTATFVVDGTSYQLTAPEGTTLKDAMDLLETEGSFTYEYRNYSGLGAFVTSLNNRASTGDMVWILYVNGEKSTTGISSTRIRSGDVIEWKLEESY